MIMAYIENAHKFVYSPWHIKHKSVSRVNIESTTQLVLYRLMLNATALESPRIMYINCWTKFDLNKYINYFRAIHMWCKSHSINENGKYTSLTVGKCIIMASSKAIFWFKWNVYAVLPCNRYNSVWPRYVSIVAVFMIHH